MKKILAILTVACIAFCSSAFVFADHHKSKAKYTIKKVMQEAMKKGKLKKVLAGDASDDEKKELLDLYISLMENKAKVGDADSWHKKSEAVVLAAAAVVVGRDGAMDQLKGATNCKACHDVHKPKN